MQYDSGMTNTQREPRLTHSLRLTTAAVAEVQRIADRDGLTWSEAARRMLKFASQKMPNGWHR